MKTTFAVIASLASIASAQVTALITPTASSPAGCATSYPGTFQISAVNVSSLPKVNYLPMFLPYLSKLKLTSLQRADFAITLNGGILKDQQDRTGYVASNYQFQFDGPPQTGAVYTGGWSICSNGSLALGGSTVFYQCLSGNFYNLYTESLGGQCTQILIQTSGNSAAGSGVVGQSSDGQATATAIASLSSAASVSQISDGQPQAATSAASISQISDGQLQGATSAMMPPMPSVSMSEASDGQIQVPTTTPAGATITQIPDGQIQGATSAASNPSAGAPISQISDGQIQGATSVASSSAVSSPPSAPISQIPDGQIQGATSTASVSSAVISQISDGQIQASTAATLATSTSVTGAIISQIGDGQIQAPTATNGAYASATATPSEFEGAANNVQVGGSLAAVAFGLIAALL